MNLKPVARVLGMFLTILAAILLVPGLFALWEGPLQGAGGWRVVLAFLAASALSAGAGTGALRRFDVDLAEIGPREGCAIVTGTWVTLAGFGCLPYWFSGYAGLTDAYFETMSGFTTTGASVFTELERMPRPLMLWRCLSQWIGGMGIVVLGIAILPMLGAGGASLFKAEAPGGATFEKPVPRIQSLASFLWKVYLAMSVAEAGLLLLGGMTLFEAVCHTATTLSTGGFSTSSKSVANWGPFVQWVITVFMFLSGMSFLVHRLWMKGEFRAAWDNVEFRAYAYGIGILTVVVALGLALSSTDVGGFEATLRTSAFQVVSIATTTGYATADYDGWAHGLRMLFFVLLFSGGCTGSTAGAVKVLRQIIFFKATVAELRSVVNPRAVWLVKVGKKAVDRETVANILGFGVLYFGVFFAASFVLAVMGIRPVEALSAAASCLGNVGPGLGAVGPAGHYGDIPFLGKWLLSACMLVGRLEVYSVMVLFLPRTWKE